MSTSNAKNTQSDSEQFLLPQWPMVPVLIIEGDSNPLRKSTMNPNDSSSFAPEWPNVGDFTIEQRKSTSTRSLPSPPNSRADTSTIEVDWNTSLPANSDVDLKKGTLSPVWTSKSEPLETQWPSIQKPSFEGKDADPKANTTYHIYHKKCRRHYIITTVKRPKKKRQCCLGLFRRKTGGKDTGIEVGIEKGLISDSNRGTSLSVRETMLEDFPPEKNVEEEGYFIHAPRWYKCRPRTFRRGTSKESSTILAELPTAWFWKKFRIPWVDEGGGVDELMRDQDDFRLPEDEKGGKNKHVTELVWVRPFSKKCREYKFTFGEMELLWKGTGTVSATGRWKSWARYNHLKLVARMPLVSQSPHLSSVGSFREVCLAKYTSSMKTNKSGALEVFDDAVERLWQEHFKRKTEGKFDYGPSTAKQSRFWDVIIATAMCMIIGEWQKRETVREIIATSTSAAAGAA